MLIELHIYSNISLIFFFILYSKIKYRYLDFNNLLPLSPSLSFPPSQLHSPEKWKICEELLATEDFYVKSLNTCIMVKIKLKLKLKLKIKILGYDIQHNLSLSLLTCLSYRSGLTLLMQP